MIQFEFQVYIFNGKRKSKYLVIVLRNLSKIYKGYVRKQCPE